MPISGKIATTAPVAALLGLAPLLFAAVDLRSGVALGSGVASALVALTLTLSLTRTTAPSAFGVALWSTLVAAVSTWIVAAWVAPAPGVVAVLPLAAVNAVWWRCAASGGAPLSLGAALAGAPVIVGALHSGADTALRDAAYAPLAGLLSWFVSPGGLLILAALVAALYQTLDHRPAPPPAQDTPTA